MSIDESALIKVFEKYNGKYFIDNCEGLIKIRELVEAYEAAKAEGQPDDMTVFGLAHELQDKLLDMVAKPQDCMISWNKYEVSKVIEIAMLRAIKSTKRESGWQPDDRADMAHDRVVAAFLPPHQEIASAAIIAFREDMSGSKVGE